MSSAYGADYFQHSCGLPYERNEPHWLRFFGRTADEIVARLAPGRALDAGCAKGFLVEALRDRGVEAFGFDISEYAIGEVREDIRKYCWVADLAQPIRGHYDLVTCIEVVEHLSEQDGSAAIRNLAAASDRVLFSSTPSDFKEPTHQNVQSVLFWLRLFRDLSFAPDPEFDATFISPQAVLLRRTNVKPADEVLFQVALARQIAVATTSLRDELEESLSAVAGVDDALVHAQQEHTHVERELEQIRSELQRVQQQLAAIENSLGWSMLNTLRNSRDRLLPGGTRRRRWADLGKRATNILLQEGVGGLRAAWRKRRGLAVPADDAPYAEWIAANEPGPDRLLEQRKQAASFQYRPLISVIMPLYNPERAILQAAIESLSAQTYGHWELCLAGIASPQLIDEVSKMAQEDPRVHLCQLPENLGISGNSNECLRLARGEFVAFLDQDDTLAPFALHEVVKKLNAEPALDFIYTDRDLLAEDGSKRFGPLCKPDWSPELVLSANYLAHMTVIRRKLVDTAGGFRPEFDGAQDWDLSLRVLAETNRIAHIPVIAYHWRELPTSAASGINAKPYAQQKQLEVVAAHLGRLGIPATATFLPSGPLRVTWPVSGLSLVSIIIPNRDHVGLLKTCIESLTRNTRYPRFEIIVVENGSSDPRTFRYYEELKSRPNVRVVTYDQPFNYSAVNNFGVQHASGNLLLFLNNDIEALDSEWLEELVRWAERPDIGAVGAKLLYPDGRIQHAGVVLGLTGFAGHAYAGCREGQWDCFGSTEWYRDYLAVTGACVMVRRDAFEQSGGFDEQLALCGNDVEFCLRLRDLGYRTVYTPFARLLHHESATRGTSIPACDFQRSLVHYERYLRDGDPFFNPNLSYWHTAPRLRTSNSPFPLEFCRRFVEQLEQPSTIVKASATGAGAEERQQTTVSDNGTRPVRKGQAGTWIKRKVSGSRLLRFIPLWARYSYDATVLAHWLDFSDADLEASRVATSGPDFQRIETLNWFIPEIQHAAFGGTHTILRFASRFKREYQVQNRFVVIGSGPAARTAAAIGSAFPELASEPVVKLTSLEQVHRMPIADASIATLWLTAYFLLRFNHTRRKFYFVQDCEPLFYPAGSTAAQVEATYRFGFFGITNTRTLKHMYEQRYGGVAEYFDPAVDLSVFHPAVTPAPRERLRLFFYGRPDHPRNAFELGLAALKQVKRKLQDRVEIVSAGADWRPAAFGVKGVINNLGLLKYSETAELYRTCDMGLLLMFTRHPSYIPLELMASSCVVVTNWNPDTAWLLQDDVNCVLAAPSASCLAESISALAADPERMQRLRLRALRTVRENHSDWMSPIDKIFQFMSQLQPTADVPAAATDDTGLRRVA